MFLDFTVQKEDMKIQVAMQQLAQNLLGQPQLQMQNGQSPMADATSAPNTGVGV